MRASVRSGNPEPLDREDPNGQLEPGGCSVAKPRRKGWLVTCDISLDMDHLLGLWGQSWSISKVQAFGNRDSSSL